MAGILQYFSGEVQFNYGGTPIRMPALRGTRLTAPENFDTPDIIANNVGDLNYSAGIQYPILSMPLAITKEWFTAANLLAWLGLPTRSGPYYDVSALGDILFWNGLTGSNNAKLLTGGKVNYVRFGYSLGQFLDCMVEVQAPTFSTVTFTPSSTPLVTGAARTQNTTHNFVNNPSRVDITLSNQLVVNDEIPTHGSLSGTFETITELNSGRFLAQAGLTFQRHHVDDTSPADGTPFFVRIHPPGAAGGADVKVTINNPIYQGRQARGFDPPRQRVPLQVICQMVSDGTLAASIAAI